MQIFDTSLFRFYGNSSFFICVRKRAQTDTSISPRSDALQGGCQSFVSVKIALRVKFPFLAMGTAGVHTVRVARNMLEQY